MIDFFQTLNVKNFVFADCDNINIPNKFIDYLDSKGYLSLDTQVICFIGANKNQNKWYNSAVKYIQALKKRNAFNLTPIRIYTEGKNALDMVLAAYIGLAMGQNPTANFVIASNDQDYNSVIDHFSSIGVKISLQNMDLQEHKIMVKVLSEEESQELRQEEKAKRKGEKLTLRIKSISDKNGKTIFSKENVDSILIKLESNHLKRPNKISTLKNVIINNHRDFINEKNKDFYCSETIKQLTEKKLIELNGSDITWLK